MRFVSAIAVACALPAGLSAQEAAPPRLEYVELQTSEGDILLELEVERAPITAGNFMRYVREGRLDGTVFYRSMVLDWDPRPNGLIQGGTQYAADRILPPIAHERTSETGLSHIRGALSMARWEPGTATGDFSILLQASPSMDADPANPDPARHDGYAVFGKVAGGMEVVERIHEAPTDPEAGEGWMRGQMLAAPVVIERAVVLDAGMVFGEGSNSELPD